MSFFFFFFTYIEIFDYKELIHVSNSYNKKPQVNNIKQSSRKRCHFFHWYINIDWYFNF